MVLGFVHTNPGQQLLASTYRCDTDIFKDDLYWLQIMGRPRDFPEPDLAKNLWQALDKHLDTEINLANTTDITTKRDYVTAAGADLFAMDKSAVDGYSRILIRHELRQMLINAKDAQIDPQQAKDHFRTRFDHPLPWIETLGKIGYMNEAAAQWLFISALDPELTQLLTVRATIPEDRWVLESPLAHALPSPIFTEVLPHAAAVARNLEHPELYLPHMTVGLLGHPRIKEELEYMAIENVGQLQKNLMTQLSVFRPAVTSPVAVDSSWPTSIQSMPVFETWQKTAADILPWPVVTPHAADQINTMWRGVSELRHKPDMMISRLMQNLLEYGQGQDHNAALYDAGDQGAGMMTEGDSNGLFFDLAFQPEFFEKWALLSRCETRDQFPHADGTAPSNQEPSMTSAPAYKIKDADFHDAITKYTVDLTAEIRDGEDVNIQGRDSAVDRVIEVVNGRKTHAALVTGAPGVGKSQIARAYAKRVIDRDVPEGQQNVQVLKVNVESMLAGANLVGDVEQRFVTLFDGAMERNKTGASHIVFAIPELHTFFGSGVSQGQPSGLEQRLKERMTSPHLKLIMDVDTYNFKKFIAPDEAFVRRCARIDLPELGRNETLAILKTEADRAFMDYLIRPTDAQIEKIYDLSVEYCPNRSQPDVSLTILDAVTNRASLKRQQVTEHGILTVVAEQADLPPEHLTRDNRQAILALKPDIKAQLFNQDHAVDAVAATLKNNFAGLGDPDKPIGSFVFLGGTGVGKTALAKLLAKFWTGDEEKMIRVDMSEFMEQYSVSKLIGAPPGYTGYDQKGQLTEAIAKNPFSVVLLDEVEKAHPDVMNVFLQMLDDGRLTDSTGKTVDCTRTMILMTSNLWASEANKAGLGFDAGNQENHRAQVMLKAAKNHFRPEFLNRVDEIVVFNRLPLEFMPQILEKHLKPLSARLEKEYGVTMTLSQHAKDSLIEAGFNPDQGARPLKRAIDKLLRTPLSDHVLRDRPNPGSDLVIEDVGDHFSVSVTPPPSLIVNRQAANTNVATIAATPARKVGK